MFWYWVHIGLTKSSLGFFHYIVCGNTWEKFLANPICLIIISSQWIDPVYHYSDLLCYLLALQPILSDMSIIPCSGLVSVYMEYHSPFLYFEPLCILKAEVPPLAGSIWLCQQYHPLIQGENGSERDHRIGRRQASVPGQVNSMIHPLCLWLPWKLLWLHYACFLSLHPLNLSNKWQVNPVPPLCSYWSKGNVQQQEESVDVSWSPWQITLNVLTLFTWLISCFHPLQLMASVPENWYSG